MVSVCLLLAALFAGPPTQPPPPKPQPAQPVAPPKWIRTYAPQVSFYYRNPRPELGPKMLDELLAGDTLNHAWFKSRQTLFEIIADQLGEIAAGNPKTVRHYERAFESAPPAGKRIIAKALAICGDEATAARVKQWSQSARDPAVVAELQKLGKTLAAAKRPRIHDRDPQTPLELDRLWANFFITGEFRPVRRLLNVLDNPQAPPRLAQAVQWSLRSNLRQHPRLQTLVKDNLEQLGGPSRKIAIQLLDRTNPGALPPGRYTASVQQDWSLEFQRDGVYKVFRGGKVVAEGRYKTQADQLTLSDEKGPLANPDPAAKIATYRWQKDAGSLRFRALRDVSAGRRIMLIQNVWKKNAP